MRIELIALLIVSFVGLSLIPARAQNRYTQNPADLNMLETVFVNPAMNAHLRDKLSIGGTFYHPNLGPHPTSVTSGIIGYHMPYALRGLAAGVQYLRTDLYQESAFRISYGSNMLRPLSIGVNLDALMLSYDESSFYKFDMNDPVVADGNSTRMTWSAGIGFFLRPFPFANLGLSIDNLNRPDMAFADPEFNAPVRGSAGGSFRIYDWWNVRVALVSLRIDGLSNGEELSDHLEVGIGRDLGHGAYFRLTASMRSIWGEFQYHLINNWYFNYRYDYPFTDIRIASAGTHRFGFVYDVFRRPPLPEPGDLPDFDIDEPVGVEWPLIDPRGRLYLYTPDEDLVIYHEHSVASLDTALNLIEKQNLRPRDFGDYSRIELRDELPENLGQERIRVRPPQGMFSPEYLGALESMGFYLKDSSVVAEIVAPLRQSSRAIGLENVITGGGYQLERGIPIRSEFINELSLSTIESLSQLDVIRVQNIIVNDVTFYIVKAFTEEFNRPWRFYIRDIGTGTVVYEVEDPQSIPDEIVWSGYADDGSLLPSGVYEYNFTYEDEDGSMQLGGYGYVNIIHHKTYRDISILSDMESGESNGDQFELILDPEGRNTLPLRDISE